MATGTPWSEHDQSLVAKLWADGLSATEVTKQLPGRTRCAVLGMIHRLGLPQRVTTVLAPRTRKPRAQRPRIIPAAPRIIQRAAPKPKQYAPVRVDPTDAASLAAAALLGSARAAESRCNAWRGGRYL